MGYREWGYFILVFYYGHFPSKLAEFEFNIFRLTFSKSNII